MTSSWDKAILELELHWKLAHMAIKVRSNHPTLLSNPDSRGLSLRLPQHRRGKSKTVNMNMGMNMGMSMSMSMHVAASSSHGTPRQRTCPPSLPQKSQNPF